MPLYSFKQIIITLRDGNFTDVKFKEHGFYYTEVSLKKALNKIAPLIKFESFKKQLVNYGFFAQEHDGNKKYKYRTYPNKNESYKYLSNAEKQKLNKTCKTTPKILSNKNNNMDYKNDNDRDSVIDES
jgi:hypothetical protein